jgi:hypothetical protein
MLNHLITFLGHKPVYGFLVSTCTFIIGWVPPIDETMQHFWLFVFQMFAFVSTVVVAVFTTCSIVHRWHNRRKEN